MARCLWIGLALALSVGALECSNDALTRERAKELIQGAKELIPTTEVHFQTGGYQRGIKHGRWDNTGRRGARAVEAIAESSASFMTLRDAVPRAVVEVTGIADLPMGPTVKEAEFLWAYQNLPDPASWYAARGGEGSAVLRLYDDGWRLEKISLTYKAEPWPLSSEEQSKITAHDNDLKAQEAEWSRIVTESKRPTRTVATIDNVKRGRCSGRKYSPVSVQITDADIGSVCQVV